MEAASRTIGLDALLRPSSVAVIGASAEPARIGGKLVQALKRGGYRGPIFPVNPKQADIQGLRAYPRVTDLPQAPGLVVIVLPAAAVPEAVDAALERGAGGIAVLSGGFSETGADGERAEARLRARCAEAGVALLGPNCLGVMNLNAGLVCTFSTVLESVWPTTGPISIVSQSGAFGGYCYGLAAERGLGFSKWVATGNEADVDVARCIEWLAGDPETELILAQMEGCNDGRRMIGALEAVAEAGKAIVVLKAGATEPGARAAQSHTAALVGQDRIWDVVLRTTGAYRAQSMSEMIDVAYAFTHAPKPRTRSVGIVTGSGGFGVLLADAAAEQGLTLPAPPDSAQQAIKAIVPIAATGNPIDATGQLLNDIDALPRIIAVALEQAAYPSVVVFLQHLGRAPAHFARFKQPLIDVRKRFPDRVLVLCGSFAPEGRAEMEAGGFLVFEEPRDAVRAIRALCHFAESRSAVRRRSLPLPEIAAPDQSLPTGPRDEFDSRQMLAPSGIPFVDARLASTREEAIAAARELGFPVALKIVSADIPHKTELRAVALGLADESAVRRAWDDIGERVRREVPHARIRGMTVAPMVQGGVETVLGFANDSVFGPVVVFGLGGVDVELLGDTTSRPAPIDLPSARDMIREIRGYPLLSGSRGRPPVDTEALAEALVALSWFGAQRRDRLCSIDINPFIVLPEGGCAVDALLVE